MDIESEEVEAVSDNLAGDPEEKNDIVDEDEDINALSRHPEDTNDDSNPDPDPDQLVSGGDGDDGVHILPITHTQAESSIFQHSSGGSPFPTSFPAANVKIVKVVPLPHARSEVWSYFGFIADDDGEIQDKKKAICKICASTLAYSGNTTNLFTHLKAMHPEANPQKLAPTNKTPRTGRKLGKRKFYEIGSSTLDSGIGLNNSSSNTNNGGYIIRTVYPNDGDTSSIVQYENEPNSNGANIIKSPNSLKTSLSVANSSDNYPSPSVAYDEITNSIVNMLVKDCRPVCIVEGKGFEEMMKLLAPNYRIPSHEKLKSLVKKRLDEVRRNLILRAMDDDD